MENTRSRYHMLARTSWIAPLAIVTLLVVLFSLPASWHLRLPVNEMATALYWATPVLALVGLAAGVLALIGARQGGVRRWPAIAGTAGSSLLLLIVVFIVIASAIVDEKKTIALESAEGQALLQGHDAADYVPLKKNWVEMLPYHTGPASAVMVMNSLQPGKQYTQNKIFNPETAHIITQDGLLQSQLTLEKLADMIHTLSGLKTEIYHAGPGTSEYDHSEFVEHLKKNRESPDDQIIISFSRAYLQGVGTMGRNASPVAAYNEEQDMVLMLYPQSNEEFWISSSDIYGAMNTIDKASDKHRGWLVVRR
jgi:hypothetical protein